MKKKLHSILFLAYTIANLLFSPQLKGQSTPSIAWDKSLGGNNLDVASIILQTNDGGYLVGGYSSSNMGGARGALDYYIAKLGPNGNVIWDKAYGGANIDRLFSLIQTNDGGYLLCGDSQSGVSGDKSEPNRGLMDFWIVKIDAQGNKQWDKTYGGPNDDSFPTVLQASDGGYLLAGSSNSAAGGDKTQSAFSISEQDFWVLRLDSQGNKIWDKIYGGGGLDACKSIAQTPDGGFILAGTSYSSNWQGKTALLRGESDYWVVKINSNGNLLWDKAYGGSSFELLESFKITEDNGFILGGLSRSNIGGEKSEPNKGGPTTYDYWIVKTDPFGNKVWDKTFGGASADYLKSVSQTKDNGYILGGWSYSGIGGDKTEQSQQQDYWLVKTDSLGTKQWDKTYGGNDQEDFGNIDQTSDGGYIVAGSSRSNSNVDKSMNSFGGSDYWVLKLNPSCLNLNAEIETTCNNGQVTLKLNISGIQAIVGTPSWSLNYTLNGVPQLINGSASSYILTQNATPGFVYSFQNLASGSCTINLNRTVTIEGIPLAPITVSGSNCGAGSVELRALGKPKQGKYFWYDSPSTATAVQIDTTGIFNTPYLNGSTTYYVSTANKFGCEGPRTPVTASVKALNISAGANDSICGSSSSFQLSGFAPSSGIWSGQGVNSNGFFTANSVSPGSYTLTYSIIDNGCTFSSTKEVVVLEPVRLGADLIVCDEQVVTIASNYSTGSFYWSDGSRNPTLRVTQPGRYWVEHTFKGCTTLDTIQVTFKPCPSPTATNIITLNGDGLNETFKPLNMHPGKLHLQIYSRWGTLIYESKDYQNNWPNKDVNDGTYYYLIQNLDSKQSLKGWIEVMH